MRWRLELAMKENARLQLLEATDESSISIVPSIATCKHCGNWRRRPYGWIESDEGHYYNTYFESWRIISISRLFYIFRSWIRNRQLLLLILDEVLTGSGHEVSASAVEGPAISAGALSWVFPRQRTYPGETKWTTC